LLREAIGKRRILEFGPGHSTYAWIEAGCEVVSLENHDGWRAEKVEEFNMYPQVHIGKYEDTAPKATVSTLVDTRLSIRMGLLTLPWLTAHAGTGSGRSTMNFLTVRA
jgi:hypothetical protein